MKRLAFLMLLIVLVSCGPAYRGEPLFGPLPDSNPQVARGQVVYDRHCQECHPGGDAGLGPGINNKPLPAALIKFQVRQGLGAMPAFPEELISDTELDALVEYLLELRAHGR